MRPHGDLARTAVDAVMSRRVLGCAPDSSARQVAQLMTAEGIHCAVVEGLLEEEGGLRGFGVISSLDLATVAPGALDELTAAEIAASEPVMVEATDSLEEAVTRMVDHRVTHLIVVDGDPPRPVGVISTLDVARAVAGSEPPDRRHLVLELSPAEARLTRTALQALRDTFGREQHELRDVAISLLARLPEE